MEIPPEMLKRSYCNNKNKFMLKKRIHSVFRRGTEDVRDNNNSWLLDEKRISDERNWETDNGSTGLL